MARLTGDSRELKGTTRQPNAPPRLYSDAIHKALHTFSGGEKAGKHIISKKQMDKATFNSIPGAPELPASVDGSSTAINSYIANLVMHAAKVEKATNSSANAFRWSVNEEMQFRGTIVTDVSVVL